MLNLCQTMSQALELLSDDKVELALSVHRVVESPSPVHTEQTDHREEHPHADTGRALDLERVEVAQVAPAVSSFEEKQGVNR